MKSEEKTGGRKERQFPKMNPPGRTNYHCCPNWDKSWHPLPSWRWRGESKHSSDLQYADVKLVEENVCIVVLCSSFRHCPLAHY